MNRFIKKITIKNLPHLFAAGLLFFSCAALFADSTHVVQKGETLYAISRKYQITVAELRLANNMAENDVLKAGQSLVIPSADISTAAAVTSAPVKSSENSKKTKTYLVQKGDTFYGIAKKNNINLAELFAMNGLGNDAVLKAGQKLIVPDRTSGKAVLDSTEIAGDTSSKPDSAAVAVSSETEQLPDLKSADPRKYSDSALQAPSVTWPVKNPKVTYVKGKVSGVQLTGTKDETVSAIRSGTIMYCGVYRGFGQVIFVQSKTGLIYAYTGLGSVSIQKGDYVVAGGQLGTVGIDTISKEPQMTLMVFQNGMPMDPAKAPRG